MEPLFFESQEAFRAWLAVNFRDEKEIWLGFHNEGTGNAGISYRGAVDEALCFGWAEGARKSINGASYKVRFTPRKPRAPWSTVAISRVEQLSRLGLMHPAGLAAFAKRGK